VALRRYAEVRASNERCRFTPSRRRWVERELCDVVETLDCPGPQGGRNPARVEGYIQEAVPDEVAQQGQLALTQGLRRQPLGALVVIEEMFGLDCAPRAAQEISNEPDEALLRANSLENSW
jgi:hypothetical protein